MTLFIHIGGDALVLTVAPGTYTRLIFLGEAFRDQIGVTQLGTSGCSTA